MVNIKETTDYLNSVSNNFKPEVIIILGSGLSYIVEDRDGIKIPYKDIPHFATSGVQGHKGELLFCEIEGKKCAIMQGRFHYYEGFSMQTCTYPIEVFKAMGAKTIFITNAAGATSTNYNVGDIMLITDHINFMGANPLIGKDYNLVGDMFPDMGNCYTKKMQDLAINCAKELNIDLKKGVYFATTGPSYETKAEVRAFSILGADVIGMSNVPEVIMANYLKLNTVTLSLVTNHATGVSDKKLEHQEVIEIGQLAGKKLYKLMKKMIGKL